VEFTEVEGPILQNGGSRTGGVFHNGLFMQATPNMVDAGTEFTAAGIAYRLGLVTGGPFTIRGVRFQVLAEEIVVATAVLDSDGDGVPDDLDNCPDEANANQLDTDADEEGDACDADDDNDTVADAGDNCPLDANPDPADADGDGAGNVCDTDDDNDGVIDAADACVPTQTGAVVNGDGCSIADLCPCENEWKNHGAYVSCTSKTAGDFLDLGLIDETEKGAIVSGAGQSQCGKKK
jgi:Thrombospondin type 3 repeat